MDDVEQERAFYQRQAARDKITEREFDNRMDETENARQYWQEEIERLEELRDDTARTQSGLEYAAELLTSLQEWLPEIDQTPEGLRTLPKDERNLVLRDRQRIIRTPCDEVIVWADGRVELIGVIDGSEGAQFDLPSPSICSRGAA